MTQAAEFRRAVIANKPATGGLNWRTVIQYASELGGYRCPGDGSWGRFEFPDGSRAHVTGLHSGSPRVMLLPRRAEP